ncbi:MAG: hypothetical protein ACPGWR_11115 [Ardenticatenaceae bacterium]
MNEQAGMRVLPILWMNKQGCVFYQTPSLLLLVYASGGCRGALKSARGPPIG